EYSFYTSPWIGLCVFSPSGLRAFNLDARHAIRKDGEPGSLFGFSLALHQQVNPNKVLLLIGAPRARALNKQTSSETGGLFKCEINEINNCERVEFDNDEDPLKESKEDQWMGVSVQSQGPGGKVVTCAHRYQKRLTESQSVLGRCYFFSQDLTIDSTSDMDGGDWKTCENRFGDTDHLQYGVCQQGLGVTFTKDYHYVVFGAPGAKNWQGLVQVTQQNSTLLDMEIYDDGPYEFVEPEKTVVEAHSYLGFSLDTGHRIMRNRNLTVVAGAPRAHHKGAVVLLSKDSGQLRVKDLLDGPGLASSFGYDVAVVDLNGDGWEDIVVGAPHFYVKSRDVGGAAFVLFGVCLDTFSRVHKQQCFYTCADIAVGAPQDDEGAGKVYIYHGSAEGIKTSPAQVGFYDILFYFYYGLHISTQFQSIRKYLYCHGVSSENQYAVTLTVGFTQDKIQDKMSGILIEVSAEIIEAKGKKTENGLPRLMPVLDATQPSRAVAEVTFLKEGCRDKRICFSNLQMNYSLYYKEISQDIFSPLPKSADNVPEFVKSYEKRDLFVGVTVTNKNQDDAYEAKLVGKFPDTLSYAGVRPTTIICTANQNGSEAECKLGNPFKRNSEVTFYIILSTTAITLSTTEIEIDLQLQTEADQGLTSARSSAFLLSGGAVTQPNQLSFGGVVKAETAMKTEEEAGSLINFTFRINNLWKPLAHPFNASLHIKWPKYNKDGKWLLYLVKVTSHGQENVVCSPQSEIHSLKSIWRAPSRAKRDVVEKERKLGGQIAFHSKYKILSCRGENKCVVLQCPLQGIDGTAVELRSRLWNSTFIEEYASFPTTVLDVEASLVLTSQAQNIFLKSPDFTVRVLVSPDSELAQFEVPWWIILMAVLAGVLILALMVFVLWKCGFFKRSKQEDSVPRYHAVRIKKETPAYVDGKAESEAFEKKQWMTTWIDNYSC
uniref:Integrin subunit alpha 6 n=1 Tax=Fundulus heteroclitus TaxID=8078 RepID=A0A3Q2Q9F5_FUNHE